MLSKPNQGAGFRRDRSLLMNVPVDYDDDLELSRTHIDLLPKQKQVQPVTEKTALVTDCRSVLGDIGNRDVKSVATPRGKSVGVTWADKVRWGRKVAPSGIPT